MVTRGFKQLLAEANAVIESTAVDDNLDMVARADVVFVDVREQHERTLGHIAGSVHAPRGFLEFLADPESPMHNEVFSSGKRLVLYCASGGRSALAAKTLQDMGLDNVQNLVGGFTAWVQAGGPVQN